MNVYKTKINGVLIIGFKIIKDARGFFCEIYNLKKLNKFIKKKFVQENLSFSKKKGTFRGMHFQEGKSSQSKLLWVIKGEIDDYIFDMRKKSPTYGKLIKININEKNNKLIFIPEGCAHGFLTKKNNTIINYKVTKTFNKKKDKGLYFKSINLNLPNNIIISDKDKNLPNFNHKQKYF